MPEQEIAEEEAVLDAPEELVTYDTAEDVEALGEAAKSTFDIYATALTNSGGYIELVGIGIAVGVALLAAFVVKWLANYQFNKLKNSENWKWVLRPLVLLPALFSLITLSIARPLTQAYVQETVFYYPAIQIVLAWLMIHAVHMLIKSHAVAWFISFFVALIIALQTLGFLEPVSNLLDNIGFKIGKSNITVLGVLHGVVICMLVFWLAQAISKRVEKQLKASKLNYNVRELFIKFTRIIAFFIAFMLTLNAIGVDMTAFAIFGGALGVGLGLGLQKITANFVSGITLLMERSIRQGDLITVDGIQGYVRELNIRYTLVEMFNGQEVSIPNETLTSNNIINSTMHNARGRIEINVGVAYGSDYTLVRKLLLEAASTHERALKDPEPGCFMIEFGDSSVNFQLMFWVGNVTDGLLGPQSDVMFKIAELFAANNITIPFPQRDLNVISMPAIKTENAIAE